MLKVSLNDAVVEVAPNTSLKDALSLLKAHEGTPPGTRVVVAVNKEFVARSAYATVILREGDEIDLVRPVWGG